MGCECEQERINAMSDYRIIYKNIIGACASCKHVRSKEEGLHGCLIEYDGGKIAYCNKGTHDYSDPIESESVTSSAVIYIKNLPIEPDLSLPINRCWESQ